MDTDWYSHILILIGLLSLSALFSGSEVALFSLNSKKLEETGNKRSLLVKYILKLLDQPKKLLVSILIGNTITNVAASIISVTLALKIAQKFGYSTDFILIVQIVVLTILILLFAEVTPKVWASKHPLSFAKLAAVPIYWTNFILSPISKFLSETLKFFAESLSYDKKKSALSTEDFVELADIGVEKGMIEEEEQELIQGVVSFRTITVQEIMTPRVDIVAVSVDTTFDELLNTITESGHSRLPLYENSLDNILGIIYAKDLLPYIADEKLREKFNIKKIARECFFVPETKLISELMNEFQEKKMHIGIVVDEYGGTSGLISLEDILEEIVGEIRDEHDKEEETIIKLNENKYIVDGKTTIDELNEYIGVKLLEDSEDYDSLGGFIFNQTGAIPEVGYSFNHNGYKFSVKDVKNNRIHKVLIEKL